MSRLYPALAGLVLGISPLAAQAPFTVQDLHALKEVSDPQIAPDGGWVAYTVDDTNRRLDREVSDLWMTSWDGQTTIRLTSTPTESEHSPRWSPDGRFLSFLSSRGNPDEVDQLWLLSRRGGEAERISDIKTGIDDYAWSPDGKRLVLVVQDDDSVEVTSVVPPRLLEVTDLDGSGHDPGEDSTHETDPPIVIDRFSFKQDYTGYLRRKRSHLYLFDLTTRRATQLTHGQSDDLLPSWSPDGQYLVFSSKRAAEGEDPDRHDNWDLYVIQAQPGAVGRRITSFTGPDNHPDWESRPAWSPDGRFIAYLQGGPDSLIYYPPPRLAVIPWGGTSAPTILTRSLDRAIGSPRWSADGRSLFFLVEDDRNWYLARTPVAGGPIERVVDGRRVVAAFTLSSADRVAALIDAPDRPAEVFAAEGSEVRALSHQNDSLLALRRIAPVEEITVKSRDGTMINGFLVRPTGEHTGPVPTVLQIHGGPVYQFQNDFQFYWQLLAANGYAVVAMNPRGSSGRGEKFALAIWADWGNKDAQDVIAGVDWAVKQGIADPNRLGVGGWSYGGILTNYVIAQDTRFKAATSGASISNILAGYGTDMYVREYEAELGVPWKNTAAWLRLSSPFLHADRIKTATLFLCGERDMNVPLLNSEQMYQALRSQGVPTRLVIYPGQWHGLGKPSYQQHRFEQYLAWFGEYLAKP